MIDGVTALLAMENKLEAGESIDELLDGSAPAARPADGAAQPAEPPAAPVELEAKPEAEATVEKTEDRPFVTYKDVTDTMAEYLTKGPYEVEVGINKVKVKLHHNPKGASGHSNIMSKVLTEDMFNKLSQKTTSNGITFAKCIETGVPPCDTQCGISAPPGRHQGWPQALHTPLCAPSGLLLGSPQRSLALPAALASVLPRPYLQSRGGPWWIATGGALSI